MTLVARTREASLHLQLQLTSSRCLSDNFPRKDSPRTVRLTRAEGNDSERCISNPWCPLLRLQSTLSLEGFFKDSSRVVIDAKVIRRSNDSGRGYLPRFDTSNVGKNAIGVLRNWPSNFGTRNYVVRCKGQDSGRYTLGALLVLESQESLPIDVFWTTSSPK